MDLKIIGKSVYGVKKFLTPYKWKTIWSEKMTDAFSDGSTRELATVVQYDSYKDAFRSYVTNGVRTDDVDINFLITEYPELKEVLKRNGINI